MEYSSLEKEYHRLPKKEELEQHIKELSKTVEELNDEISLVGILCTTEIYIQLSSGIFILVLLHSCNLFCIL